MQASELERERFKKHVEQVALRLDELAAKVRRVDTSDPAHATQTIIHDLAWGFANLNVDDLPACVRYIRDYEQAEAKQEEAQG